MDSDLRKCHAIEVEANGLVISCLVGALHASGALDMAAYAAQLRTLTNDCSAEAGARILSLADALTKTARADLGSSLSIVKD